MVKGRNMPNKKAPVAPPRRKNRPARNWAGSQLVMTERKFGTERYFPSHWLKDWWSRILKLRLTKRNTWMRVSPGRLATFFDTSPGANSYLSTVDQYQVESVEVYIEISNMPFNNFFRRFNVWYKPDYDDNNVVDWTNLQRRNDVQFKWMNPVDKPRIHLMTFTPRGNFRNSVTGSDPSNMIPGPNTWFDIAAPDQNFVGLKIHVEVNSGTGETFIPRVMVTSKAHIKFRGQI